MNNQVELKNFEAQEVYSIRKTASVYEMPNVIGELFKNIRSAKLEITGPLFSVYYDQEFNPEKADYEICLPVKGNKDQITNTIEGGKHAVIVHKGSYDEIPKAYETIMKWIEENGYTITNPPKEVYLVGSNETKDPKEYVTEVRFPIAKK
jgi:effector-binding domain-containing protein